MKKDHSQPRSAIWISGINPVREALGSDAIHLEEMVVARKDPRILELLDLAAKKRIPVRTESREVLSAVVGHEHHQGIALRADEYPYIPLESILSRPQEERDPILLLDSIQDPQNLGALARSACFLGARGIVIPKDRSAKVTASVIKVAAGAVSYIPIIQVTNLTRAMEELKDAGLWIVGLDLQAASSLYETDLSIPLGIVVGNEQKGIRPLIRRSCDLLVRIPPLGPLQSLNAATAGAIALAEVQRQRIKKAGRYEREA